MKVDRVPTPQGQYNSVYPWHSLEPGLSFFVPNPRGKTAATIAHGRQGEKYTTRTRHEREVDGSWIECKPDDEGATEGIRIWLVSREVTP